MPAIKVGAQGAASGPHADYGRQIEMGVTMAAEEINAAGGVAGCKIEVKFMDDENKAAVPGRLSTARAWDCEVVHFA